MERIVGVYIIRCNKDDRVYIGSSINVRTRYNSHRTDLRRQLHHCKDLQDLWNTYKEEYFSFSLLDECSKDELLKKEQEWMDKYEDHELLNRVNAIAEDVVIEKEEGEYSIASRRVCCMNVLTGEMLEFGSPKHCSNVLGIKINKVSDTLSCWSGISKCNKRTRNGWLIYFKEDYPDNPPKYELGKRDCSSRNKPVIVMNLETKKEVEYKGVGVCLKSLNLDPRRLYECLDGVKESYRGLTFRYKDTGVPKN